MKNNLAVLLIFYARPNTLLEVFKKVKLAKPAKLFLACDGPRASGEEKQRIEECKKIVESIDWKCEVHKRYSEVNRGCGLGPSEAISWAFEFTDRLIVLEDDCVPDDTFFPFMEEMLEKFKDDSRVGFISGFNHFRTWNCGSYSYFFAKTAATLGWGTWKRVWDLYDFNLRTASDYYLKEAILGNFTSKRIAFKRYNSWEKVLNSSAAPNYWDVQFGFLKYSQSLLGVVPKANLICNIGVGVGSTHTENRKKRPWKKGDILFMPTTSMSFPINHPNFVVCDNSYDIKVQKLIFKKKIIKRIFRKIFKR